MLVHLNHLDTCIRAILYRRVWRNGNPRYAKSPIAGLIEAFDEGDVEIRGVGAANGKVDEHVCPWVAGVNGDGTTVKRPLGSVGV